jgi:CheY-like chemotaxis protein
VKVLVVDPDSRRAPALKDALMTGGAEVTVASSGSFALTMLERNRHDVVVSRAHIDDMHGHELCAILKADPSTRDVRFVLVASAEEVSATETAASGVDLVLPPGMTGSALPPLIIRLMQAAHAPAVEPAPPPAPEPTLAPASPAATKPPGAVPVTALPSAPRPTGPVAPPASVPREAAPPAPGVPRIRPQPGPPPAATPPKSYATAVTAGPEGPWAKTTPKTAATPPATKSTAPSAPPAAKRPGPAPAPAARPVPARTAVPPQVADLLKMPSGTFQGSLEVMELADLTQAIAGGGKSGRLILALPQGGGLLLFEKGRVVHAEYCNAVGEEAFGALLAACHADGAGRFCFLPSPAGDASGLPRTIDKSVDRLLLSSATAIDEKG